MESAKKEPVGRLRSKSSKHAYGPTAGKLADENANPIGGTGSVKARSRSRSVLAKPTSQDSLGMRVLDHYRAIARHSNYVGACAYEEHITTELALRVAQDHFSPEKKEYVLSADINDSSQPEQILKSVVKSGTPFCCIFNNNKREGSTGYDVVFYRRLHDEYFLYLIQAKVQKSMDSSKTLGVRLDPSSKSIKSQALKIKEQIPIYETRMLKILKDGNGNEHASKFQLHVVGCFFVYGVEDIWAFDVDTPEYLVDVVHKKYADKKIKYTSRPILYSKGLCIPQFICTNFFKPESPVTNKKTLAEIAESLDPFIKELLVDAEEGQKNKVVRTKKENGDKRKVEEVGMEIEDVDSMGWRSVVKKGRTPENQAPGAQESDPKIVGKVLNFETPKKKKSVKMAPTVSPFELPEEKKASSKKKLSSKKRAQRKRAATRSPPVKQDEEKRVKHEEDRVLDEDPARKVLVEISKSKSTNPRRSSPSSKGSFV